MSFHFMAAIIICSDFGAPKLKSITVPIVSPCIYTSVYDIAYRVNGCYNAHTKCRACAVAILGGGGNYLFRKTVKR